MPEPEVSESSRGGLGFSPPGRVLVGFAAFVVVIAGVRAASTVVVPVLLAAFFAINLAPLLRLLQRWMPFAAALAIVLLVQIGVFAAASIGVGGSLQQLLRALPSLRDQIGQLDGAVSAWFQQRNLGVSAEDVLPLASVTELLGSFINGLLRTFSDGFLVLLMTAFMLAESAWFSAKLDRIDSVDGQTRARVGQVLDNVRRYVAVKTVASAATGLLVWLGLSLLGIRFAEVWGLVAFLLNYVPTIGSIAAGVPPIALALANPDEGIVTAVLVLGLYGLVNQTIGSVLEPRWQGHRLGLSPLIVIVSLLFWGWVLGPIGMLLSAPITMALKIACEEYAATRWIAILLGGAPEREVGKTRQHSSPRRHRKPPT